MIQEKFWDKNFGPMGHPWGLWGQDLRRTWTNDLSDFIFWSYRVHLTTLTQWHARHKPKIWKRLGHGVLGVYHQVPYLWTEGTDRCSEPFFLQVFSQPSLPSSQHQSLYCPVPTLPTLSAALHCWAPIRHFCSTVFLKSSKWSRLSAAGNSWDDL